MTCYASAGNESNDLIDDAGIRAVGEGAQTRALSACLPRDLDLPAHAAATGTTRAESVCCRGEFDGHREIPSCMCKAGSAHPQPDANGKGFWQDRIARIAFDDPIHCVSFHSPYLPALGLERHRLIESLPAFYPQTRQWAQAAFDQSPETQGIAYGSRRHDAGSCIMLFGQRIPRYPDKPFNVIEHVSLAELPARSKVVKLAASLKIGIV